jgi:putative hydrolase of the HAD superfamily
VAGLGAAHDAGWTPVIVTNGTVMQQERKIRTLGLEPLVAGWVISEAAGVKKPDARIFQFAAEEVGMTLVGGWMVGDHPIADIGGAHALGLSTCWVTRGRVWLEAGFEPTRMVDGCAQALIDLLELDDAEVAR